MRTPALTALALLACAGPASAAQGVIAAYERYVVGSGFNIALVDAQTGAAVALPAGVNTSQDEVHPTLSPDGRYLVFMRTRLVPRLNGEIVPPADRRLVVVDRQTGAVAEPQTLPSPAGPVLSRFDGSSTTTLHFGVPHSQTVLSSGTVITRQRNASAATVFTNGPGSQGALLAGRGTDEPGRTTVTTHAAGGPLATVQRVATGGTLSVRSRLLTVANVDDVTGATTSSAVFTAETVDNVGIPQVIGFADVAAGGGHPVARPADGYVALHAPGTDGVDDISTLAWPLERQAVVAPAPITTSSPERMPAWSPDSLLLGFVRHSGGRRQLRTFDLTPGIQAPLTAPVDLGAEAPTPQLRAYQAVWGGLSLAPAPAAAAPTIICDAVCLSRLRSDRTGVVLSPGVLTTTRNLSIGIVVARVTGTRRLLGRRVPRIVPVGRVPLGRIRQGRNRFVWDGRVAGRRLRAGTYLITYRSLRGRRVLSTSASLRVRIDASGRVTSASRQG